MVHFKIEVREDESIFIPGMNLIIKDLTEGDVKEYAFQVVAEQLGHTQFVLEEEIAERL